MVRITFQGTRWQWQRWRKLSRTLRNGPWLTTVLAADSGTTAGPQVTELCCHKILSNETTSWSLLGPKKDAPDFLAGVSPPCQEWHFFLTSVSWLVRKIWPKECLAICKCQRLYISRKGNCSERKGILGWTLHNNWTLKRLNCLRGIYAQSGILPIYHVKMALIRGSFRTFEKTTGINILVRFLHLFVLRMKLGLGCDLLPLRKPTPLHFGYICENTSKALFMELLTCAGPGAWCLNSASCVIFTGTHSSRWGNWGSGMCRSPPRQNCNSWSLSYMPLIFPWCRTVRGTFSLWELDKGLF